MKENPLLGPCDLKIGVSSRYIKYTGHHGLEHFDECNGGKIIYGLVE